MARIKIVLPTLEIGQFTIPIRISDINYGNHVGNDAFVSIIHEARMQWLKLHGYTEMNFAGTGLIMSDIAIEFKQESIYGDIILIEMYAGETTRVSFELYYQLSVQRDNYYCIVAKAKTGMVCYDYTSKKTVSIPEKALKLLIS
jgi:acyl-CoA thioesterase FadM